jgi:pilus assembly protein CpaB
MKGIKRGVLLALGATAAGVAGAYLANNYVKATIAEARAAITAEYETVDVVVANRDLAPGVPLGTGDVAARAIPRTYLHDDAVRAEEWPAISGRALAVPVNKGEAILATHLSLQAGAGFSSRLMKGFRALTIPVDEQSSISGMLSPDDHVDLLVTLSDENDSYTFPLMRNVRVIATGNRTNGGGRQVTGRYRNVTIAVAPEDAARIVHAMEIGRVTVALRADSDRQPGPYYRIDRGMLLGKADSDAGRPGVEIIVGGMQ